MLSNRFTRVLLLAAAALTALLAVNATQVMSRPANYKEAPHKLNTTASAPLHHIQKRATGKQQFAYFTNWFVKLENSP